MISKIRNFLFGISDDIREQAIVSESDLCYSCGGDMTKTLKHGTDEGNIVCEYCWIRVKK